MEKRITWSFWVMVLAGMLMMSCSTGDKKSAGQKPFDGVGIVAAMKAALRGTQLLR